jgi:hypothetical protein
MPRSLLLPALLAAALLAGCAGQAGSSSSNSSSSTKFQGDQRLVANAVEDLESAARPGKTDTGKICRDLVTPGLAKALGARAGTCEKGVDAALKDADAYQLTVQAVKITGTTAAAQVKVETGKKDRVQSVGLEKVGAGWRVARLR